MSRRTRWIVVVVGAACLHVVLGWIAGDSFLRLLITDVVLLSASGYAAISCFRTATCAPTRQRRLSWLALAGGVAAWWVAAAMWTLRELVFDDVAPEPTWLDLPFFMLAPSFAIALVFDRLGRPSRRLQLRELADLVLVTAAILIVGTLVLADPLVTTDSSYVIVAIGYPGFYLAVVVLALRSFLRDAWGPRRSMFGILIWAQIAFAAVDLLYGAKVLQAVYQTGIEDTLWLMGMLAMCWAAAEERELARTQEEDAHAPPSSWYAVVGAFAIVSIATLSSDAVSKLDATGMTIVAVATFAGIVCIGLRIRLGDRAEHAYLDAVAAGEEVQRTLDEERIKLNRLRAVGTLAGGTAHELNNLLQAIVGNLALLRRRAGRGEDLQVYLGSIEKALALIAAQVSELRKLTPTDTARGMVFILPGGDRDGSLGVILADAGFAPASLPDPDAALRAAKHDVYAIVASSQEADELEARGVGLPIIRRDTTDIVGVVVEVVELVSRANRGNGSGSPASRRS